MNPELNYMLAREHIADLQRDADRARRTREVDARRRGSPNSNPITRLNARISSMSLEPMVSTSVQASSAGATDVLVLAGGTRLRLRPLGSEDRNGFAALFARLSPESRYRRFLSPKRELTPRELSDFTDIDHIRHAAFAAIDQRDASIVGVGRYVRVADRPKVADLAVEVTDELQNMGIGTALVKHTVQRARDNGFALLTATTLWENRPARALLRRFDFHPYTSDGSEIELELKLDAPSDGPESTPAIEPTQPPVSITNQSRGGAQCRSSTSS